jgi:sec-independent protein translocase protein TatC
LSDQSQNTEEPTAQMSFLGHLEELRWRLVRSAVAIMLVAVVIFIFTKEIIENLYLGMVKTDFISYRVMCKIGSSIGLEDSMCVEQIKVEKFIYTELTGQFNSNMYIAIVGGFIVAFPFIFYQVWGFVKPALKERELSVSKGVMFWASLLFFMGVLFGYFLISPLCIQFFGNYQMTPEFHTTPKGGSLINLITTTTLLSGIFYELPVVIYIGTKLGLLTPELLKKYRKHAIVIVLVMSALITPPDVISQIMVAIPIMLLYESGIYISKLVIRRKLEA